MLRNIAYCVSVLLLLSVVLGLVSEEGAGQDGSTWTNMDPALRPAARSYHAMAYDSESDRVVLFGGLAVTDPPQAEARDDTWAYDVNTDTWTTMDPVSRPSPRFYHAMAYDSESDRVVLFGGFTATGTFSDETWTYDLDTNTWTDVTLSVGPSGRANHAMAYDSESARVVLFGGSTGIPGGYAGDLSDDTWTYDTDTNTWTDVAPAVGPSARIGHVMAYDTESDQIVLFGGSTGVPQDFPENLSDDTWTYDTDTNTWTDMTPATGPSARSHLPYQGMAYDAESDRIVLFSGFLATGVVFDTWTYDTDTNTWTDVTPATSPSALVGHAMAYDAESDRVILFGGNPITGNVIDETWAYDLDTDTPADTTKPTITITSPANGEILNSTSVTVTGTASDDVAVAKVELSTDGTTWVLATGTTSWSGTVTLAEGANTIFARATDSSGNMATVSIAVTVDTVKPTADAGEDQRTDAGAMASFDASASSDDVAIVSYEWDFGDGTTGTDQTTTHIYTDPGTYTVTLTVRDAAGNADTDVLIVTVETEPVNPIPPEVVTFGVVGAIAAAAAGVALFLWRRRAGGKEKA